MERCVGCCDDDGDCGVSMIRWSFFFFFRGRARYPSCFSTALRFGLGALFGKVFFMKSAERDRNV